MATLLRIRREDLARPRKPIVRLWLNGRLVRVPVDRMALDWFRRLVGGSHWVDVRVCTRRPKGGIAYRAVTRVQLLPLFDRVCYASPAGDLELPTGEAVLLFGSRDHEPIRRAYVVVRRRQRTKRPPVAVRD